MSGSPKNERILQFGPDRRLLGLLSLPDQLDPARPAVIIPNTGFEHRVGPHRLHVHLCRAFARAGYAALRLDLSGMGDSGSGAVNDPVLDQRAAMDELERIGVARSCIVVGVCSGGHDAHRFAKADPRVVAAAFVDHYLYATSRSRRISLQQKFSDPRRVLNFLERYRRKLTAQPLPMQETWFEQPSLGTFRQDLAGFIQRRMPLFFLVTGEYLHTYNYAGQFYDTCPELRGYPLQAVHYLPEADHTFSQAAMRDRLIDSLLSWVRATRPGAPAVAA